MSTTDPLTCARGSYQRSLLTGGSRWSGSDLKGRARHWSGRYAESRKALLRRLERAGHRCEVMVNGNRVRVLFVNGRPMSRED